MTAQGIIVSASTGPLMVAPPALFGSGAPSNSKPGILGQEYFDTSTSPRTAYTWSGAEWLTDASTASVQSVTGTANQVLATPTTGNVVVSLIGPYTPATYTAHGVLIGEGTSSIAATTAGTTGQVLIGATGADPAFGALGVNSGLTAHGVLLGEGNSAIVATSAGTAGQILASGGAGADPNWTTATFPLTATAGSLIAATATNVIGQIADVATGQALMSGGVGVIPAYTGSPSFSGSVTAGTSITATAGNITATNGNIVRGTAGNKDVYSSVASTTTAGANSAGTVTLVGGTATISTTAVTASSQIRLYRQGIGATGAAALGILTLGTVTASTSFVINAVQAADATALQASDVSVIGWEIVN